MIIKQTNILKILQQNSLDGKEKLGILLFTNNIRIGCC